MSQFSFTLNDPYPNFAAVAPSDAADFSASAKAGLTRALYVGGAGDVAAVDELGNAVVFKAVPAGTVLRIRCRRVNATGTTATSIVRLW